MPPAGAGARHVHLRHRLALGHADSQRARQDALDGDGINGRNQFQIPFHRRQIERHKLSPGFTPDQRRNWSGAITPSVCTSTCWMANSEFS